jgi:hypothetical protein
MCHHPPEWLMDKNTIRSQLDTFVRIALFGHEHHTGVTADKKSVRLFAGAVQPSRRDPAHWRPTYHILQLSIASGEAKRELVVRIHTREFTTDAPIRFQGRRNEQELTFDDYRIELPLLKKDATPEISVATHTIPGVSLEEVITMQPAEPRTPTPVEIAQHELLVHFFQLLTPQRYQAAFRADLLRDGDDALDPQVMWAEVFRRAEVDKKLGKFWAAVSEYIPTMRAKPNPFPTETHA